MPKTPDFLGAPKFLDVSENGILDNFRGLKMRDIAFKSKKSFNLKALKKTKIKKGLLIYALPWAPDGPKTTLFPTMLKDEKFKTLIKLFSEIINSRKADINKFS